MDNFNLYASPSTLWIKMKSGRSLQLILHTVFTFRTRIQHNPGSRGSPLELKGVIEIPEALTSSSNAETVDFLKRYFDYPQKAPVTRFIPIVAKATKTGIQLEKAGFFSIFSKLKIAFSRPQP